MHSLTHEFKNWGSTCPFGKVSTHIHIYAGKLIRYLKGR
jgi:hypothetical protein